jgi:t-SNARE complex subunit (syntaxin)
VKREREREREREEVDPSMINLKITELETEIIELKETLDKYAEEITKLQNQLKEEKEKHTDYLTQRKTQVQTEINLIKEVLHD